jgi:hypothetical protein
MSEKHPQELELAGASEKLVDHLRWCSRCRGVAADYEWLKEEIPAAFDAGLEAVAVPAPTWESVRDRLRPRQRCAAGRQLVAIAATAVMACLMLVAPSVVVRNAHPRGVLTPDAMAVRVPMGDDQRTRAGTRPSLGRTPSPSVSSGDRSVSLPFVPPPEPPDPEA